MRQTRLTTCRRLALAAVLSTAGAMMTGCGTTDSTTQAATSRPVIAQPYVATAIPVADRFGAHHDLQQPLATEPRADVAVMESVATDAPRTADLPPPASSTEPWWKKLDLHGSITLNYKYVL